MWPLYVMLVVLASIVPVRLVSKWVSEHREHQRLSGKGMASLRLGLQASRFPTRDEAGLL